MENQHHLLKYEQNSHGAQDIKRRPLLYKNPKQNMIEVLGAKGDKTTQAVADT